jgi:hypothetical protein
MISGSMEAYMIINFRTREISRGVRNLTETSILIIIIKKL